MRSSHRDAWKTSKPATKVQTREKLLADPAIVIPCYKKARVRLFNDKCVMFSRKISLGF